MDERQQSENCFTITNREDLSRAVLHLQKICPELTVIIDNLPEVPLRLRPPGFEGLAEIITGQQVSKASAKAIFGRLTSLIVPFHASTFLRAGENPLIEAGLSRAKQKSITALAQAIHNDKLDLQALCFLPEHQAIDILTALPGIGPWTAEVFLLFCAGHADIFPAGDVALQHAIAEVLQLEAKPDTKQARIIAQRWSPVRGAAARVLYARYAQLRQKSDIPV